MAWQKIFPDPNEISPDRNRVASLTESYARNPSRLREELDRLDLHPLNSEEQELWYRVRGTLEYRAGNRDEALGFYERGLEAFPSSPVLLFSCAQEYEYRGLVDKTFPLIRQIDLKRAGSRYTLEIARYLYLWDFIDDANGAIQWIFDAYYELQEADDNFLYIRKLPFYSTAFGCRATFAIVSGSADLARKELRKSAQELGSYEFEPLVEHLEATISGNWSPVLGRLASRLEPVSSGSGVGYLAMKSAALRALSARDLADACSILDLVKLDERDHRWLEDVRSVCKAQAAHRFNNVDEEQRMLKSFLERQPLLLEPFNAFDFGLIGYQEVLKSAYRDRRIHGPSSRSG